MTRGDTADPLRPQGQVPKGNSIRGLWSQKTRWVEVSLGERGLGRGTKMEEEMGLVCC